METTIRPTSPNDTIPFQCRRCGSCCRELEDQLMLEPLDAYRLGRHLRNSGDADVAEIEDIYAKYTHAAVLAEGFPVYLINTTGPDHTCVFLQENHCSVYPARPRVCRVYPFAALPEGAGMKLQYAQCMDGHAAHFSGGTVRVRDWMRQNISGEDRTFLQNEAVYIAQLGQLLHRAGPSQQKERLFSILFYRYYNYDLERPFLEQYQRNHRELLDRLRQNGRKDR